MTRTSPRARYLMRKGEFADAVREFGAAARLDPSQPEPPTYAGWAGALVARQVGDAKASAGAALGFARAHQRA